MAEYQDLYVLLAPEGQLSANGQLRETVKERRNRKGEDVPFWYLSPELVKHFNLSNDSMEGVVAADLTAINWLKLRFGGQSSLVSLNIEDLRNQAMELPPEPVFIDISNKIKDE